MSEEFIFGKNSVEALLEKSERSINKIFILSNMQKDAKISKIIKLANSQNVPVTNISKDKFTKIIGSDVNHQGVMAGVSPINYADLDEVLLNIKNKGTLPLIVLLDNVEDPQNLGAIIRSSEVLGVDAVVIPERRSASITGIVSKVSSGAVEFLPIVKVTNISKTIEQLKKEGFWVIGAEYLPKSEFVYNVKYDMPCAVVMGSEGKGVSRLVRESCDILVKIPQSGKITSLNVANALSIVLYEIVRQRTQAK
ncbi:MAG: 23S rRNA (guanosine(2251)-2'-O)-methyltransferase RlmB [Vampirovibrionia bacterium]